MPECMHTYAYIHLYIHTLPATGRRPVSEAKVSPPSKCYTGMNKRKIKNPNKAKTIGLRWFKARITADCSKLTEVALCFLRAILVQPTFVVSIIIQ